MPTYDYECSSCDHAFELFQQMIHKPISKCPKCGKNTAKRQIGAGMGIIFKGSGFYETDYKRKNTSSAGRLAQNNNAAKDKDAKFQTSKKNPDSPKPTQNPAIEKKADNSSQRQKKDNK